MDQMICDDIKKAILKLDKNNIDKLTKKIIAEDINVVDAIKNGYTEGIRCVGEEFEKENYFLPEMIAAADMVKDSLDELQHLIPKDKNLKKGKMILGTVKGDIHDIGKDLVSMWATTQGIEVIDIGVDCSINKFIDGAIENDANIIGASCLLTNTLPELEKIIEELELRNLRSRFKAIFGGAAVEHSYAQSIGADGYGADLREASEVALTLLKKEK